MGLLRSFGTRISEGIDGFRVADLLRARYHIKPHEVTMVAWGSPHNELSNGKYSRPKAGPAKVAKLKVSQPLMSQFRHSVILTPGMLSIRLSDPTHSVLLRPF